MSTTFLQISLIIVLATSLGILARILRQPVILAYILTGIAIGLFGVEKISQPEAISFFAQIGIAFLLFMVGMELNFRELMHVGKAVVAVALGQIAATFILAFILGTFLGFSTLSNFYVALALTFSSTVIAVKLLTGRKEADSLHGKIVISVLLIQDMLAVLALMVLTALGSAITSSAIILSIGVSLLKGLGLFLLAASLSKKILPKIFAAAAANAELLFLSAISWCFLLASLALFLGFSLEIGAFLAGIALAPSTFRVQILGRIRPLRDFFVTIFFIVLGMQMVGTGIADLKVIIVLSLFVLLVKPLLVWILMSFLGYRKHSTFLSGVYLAQISEFSLILAAVAQKNGYIEPEVVAVLTVLGIVTITASTYFVSYSGWIYKFLVPILSFLENKQQRRDLIKAKEELAGHIILIGCDNAGRQILKFLQESGAEFLVVDFNPTIIKELTENQVNCLYGDISDPEILEELNLEKASLIISTIPDKSVNLTIINEVKNSKSIASLVMTALEVSEAQELYKNGADFVILPYFLSGQYLVHLLKSYKDDHNYFLLQKSSRVKELSTLAPKSNV